MKFQFKKRENPIMVSSEFFFETKAVYNPTVIKKDSKIYMLYRAESYDGHTGCIGLAWSKDGIHFTKHPTPVLVPEYDYEKIGCEDPRVVELDHTYYMVYVPVGDNPDGIQVALAKSSDLIHWEKMGPIKMMLTGWCAEKIKAPVLAPVKVNNKYILYFLGQKRGWHTAIGVAYSEDLIHWEEDRRNPVITPRYDNYDCLGVEPGATPIVIEDTIVLFYNVWDEKLTHRTWYAVFDRKDPGKLLERGEDPLLVPEKAWECKDYVPNVIFAEGVVELENQYYLYYGAEDTSIGLAISEKKA